MPKLEHPAPQISRHLPHRWVANSYGNKIHIVPDKIQRVVGSFLYYARAVDDTIYTGINEMVAF